MARKTIDLEEQFRRAIKDSGLSLYRLAKMTGVSHGVMSNFINGHRTLTLKTAAKLAPVLGVELKTTAPKSSGKKQKE
jgi:transcriptional regulator with XRE-family HTH domain